VPLFGRRIEAQRRGRVELGLHVVEMFVALSKALGSTEAVSAAVPDVHGVAAFDAARRFFDEPKAISPTRAFRASEQRPGPAVPEPDVRQADQLLPVANLNDRVRRVDLHHTRRAQARDFHALELIEKAAMIGVGAALGHG
jgi:hypothetical protein